MKLQQIREKSEQNIIGDKYKLKQMEISQTLSE